MATYYWRGGTGSLNTANTANLASTSAAAVFTGQRATTVLTVTAVASGTLAVGDTVWFSNGTGVGIINSFGTGSGGVGTYNMSTSVSAGPATMASATIGAGPITSTDDLVFDANSSVGSNTFTVTGATTVASVRNFTAASLAGVMTLNMSAGLIIFGDYSVPVSNFATAGGGTMTFAATSGPKTITASGINHVFDFTFNGVGGSWQLASNATCRICTLTNGTLDLAGFTLTCTNSFTTATGTKNLTWNGGGLTVTNSGTSFNNFQPANFTTTAGSGAGTITMSSASTKTFAGGGSTFNAKLVQGGAGQLNISGSNTFTDIDNTTNSTSVLFTAGTTTTFTAGFSLHNTTIGSTTAASHTLSKSSGTVSVSNNSISRSTAQGGATWNAFTSNGNTNGGNNVGWVFTNPPISDGVVEAASAADTVSSAGSTLNSTVGETASAADSVSDLADFLTAIAEAASALDTVNANGVIVSAALAEQAAALDQYTAIGPFHVDIAELADAIDTINATALRLKWFLSFAEVVPAPDDQGPGNTGKLFGDFRLEED